MNADTEFHIRQNDAWSKLPANIRQSLGNSQREYEKAVVNFSVKNQLRYKGNLVRHVKKDEKRYYEDLLKYSRDHLMLYPYHLSDVMVKGLRVTPFAYYISIMTDIMTQEKSYDSLPNFTAADCLRLLGIGRNQYIDLMNQCRSSKKFFRKRPVRDLLPTQPIEGISIESWWVAQTGYITEEDVKICFGEEKIIIDGIIDKGPMVVGRLDFQTTHALYRKGLLYLDVGISDDDCIIVPPLEGFVMNRVLGDYFETLLYKIFVSIDEHTSVAELASVLQIDLQLVKNAVSMYCRLGFAKKKGVEVNGDDLHPSWEKIALQNHHNATTKKPTPDQLLIDWTMTMNEPEVSTTEQSTSPDNSSLEGDSSSLLSEGHSKRIAFLFDSTLTAFLMMGNLSPGLKSHAVTMFEVGKLSDESMDSFLAELEKVDAVAEGEAQRYFDHAITLRDTIHFLRYNNHLCATGDGSNGGQGIDLLRCESLLGLDPATCARVLNKNYTLLVSMAPLSNEIRPVYSCSPQHIGPAIPEVNSVWFKLFLYHLTGHGPPSLLLVKGTKLRRLPRMFHDYDRLLITTWGHDPAVIPTSNILLTLNDALSHSAVMVQGHGWHQTEGETLFIPFPLTKEDKPESMGPSFEQHAAVQSLSAVINLKHTCGFITLLKTGNKSQAPTAHTTTTYTKSQLEITSPSVAKSSKDTVNTAVSSFSHSETGSPKNGIKDKISAEMLVSELDTLNENNEIATPDVDINDHLSGNTLSAAASNSAIPASPNRSKLTLPLHQGGVGGTRGHDGLAATEENWQSNWTLLDCSYGIPLFDANLNQQVCGRIASQGLCNKASLQELLHSSRILTLRLLNFITDNQDLPVFQEHSHESGMLPQTGGSTSQAIPLPTRNLEFTAAFMNVPQHTCVKSQKWMMGLDGDPISTRKYPKLKEVDDVLGGAAAWENVDSTQETCPKCSHDRAFFMQIQTRSADEPMTTFYKCCNMQCGNRWRE